MNRFIEHSQVVITTKYNAVTDFHTRNHSTLIYSVYFYKCALSVSWQRIYNTRTIKVSLNHTLPISLYYSTLKVFTSLLSLLVVSSSITLYSSVPICIQLIFTIHCSELHCTSSNSLFNYFQLLRLFWESRYIAAAWTTQKTQSLLLRHASVGVPRDRYLGSPLASWMLPSNEL
jgi:hypothetical protein